MTKRKIIIISIISVVFIIAAITSYLIYANKRTTMLKSHVYVCDNPKHDSDFDTWMKEELGLNWVPTYLVVKNDIVIGSFRGGISESEFSSQLGTILIQDWQIEELPNIQITNLEGNRDTLANILPNDDKFYIIEISWVTCPDCIFQDENFTKDIYKKYGTHIFYRYYMKSTVEEVSEKYK